MKRFAAQIFENKNSLGFSAEDYSKFKYGSRTQAKKFGNELSAAFISSNEFLECLDSIRSKEVVISPSPYLFIPTATMALCHYFLLKFNQKLIGLGRPAAKVCQTYRWTSYNSDYGAMNAAERERCISADSFHVDYEFLKNRFVIFLDDVRVSGGHERRIMSLIDKSPTEIDCIHLYYAMLNLDIADTADPTIENYLNYNFLTDRLKSIGWIIRNENFEFNTRVVKYILGSSFDEFSNFIDFQTDHFKNHLLYWATGNNYHLLPEFIDNFKYLQKICASI